MSAESSSPSNSVVRLTDQQRTALERGTFSVALSAGAGCGKTSVLTERFLRELEGPSARALRSVVALTFTEKAARELRQRIRARCREMIRAGVEDEARRWKVVLRGLEAAPIGTFHEFCGRLLRLHSVEAGVDPEFRVLDDSIARAIREQAVRITLRNALAQQDLDLIDLAVDFGLGQIQESLVAIVASATRQRLETWTNQDTTAILDLWREIRDRQGRPALIRQAAYQARRCREALAAIETGSAKLLARRSELSPLLDRVESGDCQDSELSEICELARISDLRGKDVWPSDEVKEIVQKQFEAVRKAVKQVASRLVWGEKSTLEEIANRQRLARIALKARRIYETLKRERNGLDFDDLQLRFIELLRLHPEILTTRSSEEQAEESTFEFILVDEFQDTDRLQSDILRALGGSQFLEGRLFVVGDYKQSIYGFRGADPSIFRNWRREFPSIGRRELNENFRSVPGVIDFVNALFADCFETAEESALISTGEAHPNRLISKREPIGDGPAVEFLWADVQDASSEEGEENRPSTRSRGPNVHELRVAEAKCLAKHIRSRLDDGWIIYDRATRKPRPAGPGDVAFLFRAMTDVGPYETALAEEGLDYHTTGGAAFFSQQEIHDVINVLSVVEDPLDEVALAGTLRSPFFSLSDDGLYWLATSLPGGLTAGLSHAEEIADLPPRDRALAIRARGLLQGWRNRKDRDTIAGLVTRILGESGYEAAIVCEFLGSRKLANVRKLTTMARDFDRQGGFLLADFVAMLRAHRDDPPREEQASTTDEEGTSIRLMSIHQSKGLEFPIVVVPDLNRSSESRHRLFAIHPDLGLVVRPAAAEPVEDDDQADDESEGSSLGWETWRALNRDQDEQESLRLFYVAITRARDSLVLSSGLSADRDPRSTSLRLLADRFNLFTGDCLADLPEGWPSPLVRPLIMRHEEEANTPDRGTARQSRPRTASLDEIRTAVTRELDRQPGIAGRSEFPDQRSRLPRLIDLDQLDGLASRTRRLNRLIRGMLSDDRLFREGSIDLIAKHASLKQIPAAYPALAHEAARLVSSWLKTDFFRRLRGLEAGSIRPGFSWTVPHQCESGSFVVIRGDCDLLIQDPDEGWTPLVVCLGERDQASSSHRMVRGLALPLSCVAAKTLGFGPVRSGVILGPGLGTGDLIERIQAIDPASIDQAVLAALADCDAMDLAMESANPLSM
jgi:ATP-dependent helicase/nuclease subunit A